MKDWQCFLLILIGVTLVVTLVILGANALSRWDCNRLAQSSRRETAYIGGICRVRVCDNVWLMRSEIVYQLDLIQSCETPAPQEPAP